MVSHPTMSRKLLAAAMIIVGFLHTKPIETTKEANEILASELEKGGSKWLAVLVDSTYRENLIITKSTIKRYPDIFAVTLPADTKEDKPK